MHVAHSYSDLEIRQEHLHDAPPTCIRPPAQRRHRETRPAPCCPVRNPIKLQSIALSRTLKTISLSIPSHDNTQTLPGKIYFAHMDMAGCKELLPMYILGNVVGGIIVFHELTVMPNLLSVIAVLD